MALYDPRTGRFRQQLGDPRYESIWTSLEEVDGCRESLAWSSFGQQCRKKKKKRYPNNVIFTSHLSIA